MEKKTEKSSAVISLEEKEQQGCDKVCPAARTGVASGVHRAGQRFSTSLCPPIIKCDVQCARLSFSCRTDPQVQTTLRGNNEREHARVCADRVADEEKEVLPTSQRFCVKSGMLGGGSRSFVGKLGSRPWLLW